MAFAFANNTCGLPPLMAARAQSGANSWNPPYGTIASAVDPVLGGGEFIWLQGSAAITPGTLVTYNNLTGVVTPTATGAVGGQPVAVAMATVPALSSGWYQISGVAQVRTTAAIAVSYPVVITATGGAVAQGAIGAPPAAAGTIRNAITVAASGAGAMAQLQMNRSEITS